MQPLFVVLQRLQLVKKALQWLKKLHFACS